MEDMDLDELDQEVNKMMSKPKGKKVRVSENPAVYQKTVSTPPSERKMLDVPDRVDMSETAVEETSGASPKPDRPALVVDRPMPKVPPRRRMHPGAMDIIQPNVPKMGEPAHAPNRVGRDITPAQPVKSEPPRPATSPVVPSAEPKRSPEEETVDVADEILASLKIQDESTPDKITKPVALPTPVKNAPAETSWPDPLDFHDLSDDKEKLAAKVEEKPEPEPPKETPPTMEQKPNPDTLLEDDNTSPFVTTKVEKRPLGAYADTPPPAASTLPELAEKPESAERVSVTDQAPDKGEMAAASIQSNQHTNKPASVEPDAGDLRSMSIPPQYHTADAKPHEEVHNLFDTKEYQAPPAQMAHAVRKGSPWLVVTIVVLAVLVVAAIAIGYFMMTGTLDFTKIL